MVVIGVVIIHVVIKQSCVFYDNEINRYSINDICLGLSIEVGSKDTLIKRRYQGNTWY